MSVGPLRLTLLVPGLSGAAGGSGQTMADGAVPRHPALQTLLARASRHAQPAGIEALRYRLFGYALSESHDHPDAWLSYQIDTGVVALGALLRADPVHLRADRSRLLLFAAGPLQIEPDEVRTLAEAFNRHFAAAGLRLEFPVPTRGYLHLPRQPELRTTPLAQAIGRDVDAHLPAGHEARDWHRLLNEVQMLFHEHPVNRARESRGRPPINSLWLWGGGRPLVATANDWQHIWCADPVVKGLARLNGIGYSAPPADARSWLREAVGDRHLVCLDELHQAAAYGDAAAWPQQIAGLERDWFVSLRQALQRGQLHELTLFPDDGHDYRITRWDVWKFWRRPKATHGSG